MLKKGMKHKLAVFDWNGTILADSKQSWQAGNECMKFFGHPPMTYRRYIDTFTFPVIHFYKRNGVNVDDVLARKEESNKLFQESYEHLAKNARTRRGSRALLRELNAAGVTCIILSNYVTKKIEAQLVRLRMEHLFHHVNAHHCNGTTILENTTKTERLSDFMVKRNFKPADSVIIGDSMEEPDIARHLGLTSIGITNGYISEKRLRAANPDHIVHNLRDISPLLRQKWGLPDTTKPVKNDRYD